MWVVETLNAVVDPEITLPKDMRAKLTRISELIEAVGVERLPHATVKHLDGTPWETRIKAASGISWGVYVAAAGRRVVIVRMFSKKTQKAPLRALELARAQAGLTQEQLAKRMDRSQSAVARMESGKVMPPGRTLERFARATGTRLRISFEPQKAGTPRHSA